MSTLGYKHYSGNETMSDKRSVSTDALETLGTIIGEGAGRDAIHLAVEPVIAGCKLYPGQTVGLSPSGQAWTPGIALVKSLGIVDPFLCNPVMAGERFWLVVFPRQITSLRHVWTHPDFPDPSVPVPSVNKEASERWLREFVAKSDCPDYDTVMAIALSDANDGEYITIGGQNASGDIPPEFWHHMEVVTGRVVSRDKQARYFSCTC